MKIERPLVLIRGGGDLATGVAARLHRTGFAVLVTEIARPLALRRLVALAEAVYAGWVEIEDFRGRLVGDEAAALDVWKEGEIPVLVDPQAEIRHVLHPVAIVDARMRKSPPEPGSEKTSLVIGLGPGFTVGLNCHAVVETSRGHRMGRVLWEGAAKADTGVPETVAGYDVERVLRSPDAGIIQSRKALGAVVRRGETIAVVNAVPLVAPFDGALRGLLHDGLEVDQGMKVGDLDPRADPSFCRLISDKSLAVGGGVLEAILSKPDVRRRLGGMGASG